MILLTSRLEGQLLAIKHFSKKVGLLIFVDIVCCATYYIHTLFQSSIVNLITIKTTVIRLENNCFSKHVFVKV